MEGVSGSLFAQSSQPLPCLPFGFASGESEAEELEGLIYRCIRSAINLSTLGSTKETTNRPTKIKTMTRQNMRNLRQTVFRWGDEWSFPSHRGGSLNARSTASPAHWVLSRMLRQIWRGPLTAVAVTSRDAKRTNVLVNCRLGSTKKSRLGAHLVCGEETTRT
jgi:hypothetical protein